MCRLRVFVERVKVVPRCKLFCVCFHCCSSICASKVCDCVVSTHSAAGGGGLRRRRRSSSSCWRRRCRQGWRRSRSTVQPPPPCLFQDKGTQADKLGGVRRKGGWRRSGSIVQPRPAYLGSKHQPNLGTQCENGAQVRTREWHSYRPLSCVKACH